MTLAIATQSPRAQHIKSGDDWLSRKEAAIYLATLGCPMSAKALAKRASNNNAGKGPSFTRFSWKCVKYLRRDLDLWAAREIIRVE